MTEAEFAALYDRNVDVVRSVLYRLFAGSPSGCPRALLDDLTQEVFLRAWRGQAGFRGQASHKTWLCRIARNVAVDALRARREERHLGVEALDGAISSSVDPALRASALEALHELSIDDRLLLILIAVEECTMSEVGEVLEIPVGTVKSRAFALRQRLHERMNARGAA